MKHRIIFITTIIGIIITSIIFNNVTFSTYRYHQHKEDQVDEEDFKDQYTSLATGLESFSTHLPLFEITTKDPVPEPYVYDELGNRSSNDDMVVANVNYYDDELNLNRLTNEPVVSEQAMFRIRGRSSRAFDKKGYLIKFKKNNLVDNKKVSLSGMVEDSDWALHGPFMDKTLIRNYLCYNLAGEFMEYSPNVRFCELILNGEYQGLYLLTEQVEYNDEGRIEITETKPNLKTTSYILQLDVGTDDPLYALPTFNYYTGKNGSMNKRSGLLEIKYPGKTLTQDQKYFIENEISQFEKALVSFDSADKNFGFPAFIDINSFVDYFIINEFTMNSDAGRLSTYYYKDLRGKLKVAVWDFNSSFNNYTLDFSKPHFLMMTDKPWYEYLLKDGLFVEKIIKRYRELRKTYLSDEYLLNYVDETIEYLGPAIDRNNEKWRYSYFGYPYLLIPKERNPKDYEEAVTQLKEAIVERGQYLDENIETLYALAHDSVNKQFKYKLGENK